MSQKTQGLKFDVTADGSQIDKAFATMLGSAKSFSANLASTLAVGAAAAATGLGVMVKNAIDVADNLNDLSIRLGVSTEALSQLEYAAKLSGSSLETLSSGMATASKNIGLAADGTGKAQRALQQLGIDAKQLKNLSPDQQLLTIADALDGVSNASDKTAIASKIFGGAAGEMLQIVDGGSASLRAMMQEADALGITLSTTAGQGAANLNDEIDKLGGRFDGFAVSIMSRVVPAINALIDDFYILSGAANQASSQAIEAEMLRVARASKILDEQIKKGGAPKEVDTLNRKKLGEMKKNYLDLYNTKNAVAKKETELDKKRAAAQAAAQAALERASKSGGGSKTQQKKINEIKEIDKEKEAAAKKERARLDEASKDFDRRVDENRKKQEEAEKANAAVWQHAIENTQDAFADMLVAGKFSFESLADIAKRAAAEAAAAWIIKPVFNAVGSLITGGTSSSVGGGGAGMSIAGSLGSKAIGLTGIGASINAAGASALPALFGTGAPVAGVVGPSQMGALSGLGLTPATLALGAAAIAAPMIIDAFKGKPHPASSFGASGVNSLGQITGANLLSKHTDTSYASGLMSSLQDATTKLAAAGLNLGGIGGGLQGGIDNGTGFLSFGDWSRKNPLDTVTFKQGDEQEALSKFLKLFIQNSSNLASVFDADLIPALKNVQVEGRQFADVVDEIVTMANKDDERKKLNADVQDSILQATDEQAYKIKQINSEFDALLKTAQGLGADTTQIELLRKISLDQVDGNSELVDMSKNMASIADSLTGTLNSMLLGANSALSPEEQLALANKNFNAAMSFGDYAALGDAGTALTEIARAQFGSSSQYKGVFSRVTSGLKKAIFTNMSGAVSNAQQAVNVATGTVKSSAEDLLAELLKQQQKTNNYIKSMSVKAAAS